MISQFIRPATRLRPGPISVRRNRAFRPASVLGLDELESRVVPSVTLSVTAAPYYADPSGVADATAAIQHCINDVSKAGGGTVSFPAGTYKISFAGAGRSTTTSVFTIPSNITLAGHSENDTTILFAPNQGNYVRIFAQGGSSNIVLQDLTIDQNGLNNGGTLPNYTTNTRMIISFANCRNAVVQRCRFTNIVADCTIAIYGESGSTTISHNTFDNVGLNTTNMSSCYDYSTIYTDAANVTVDSNTFSGRLVNGTTIGAMGATTAIEIHGHDQQITNNTVSDYAAGVNVACSNNGYSNANQFYQNNTFTNIGTAFVLWPGTAAVMTNTKFLNNNITVDVKDYINYWMNGVTQPTFVGCGGITEIYANQPGPTSGMIIDSNTITFTNYTGISIAFPAFCNGISLRPGTSAANTNVTITNNHINHPLGAGIYLDTVINGLTITGNVITDPGSSATTLSSADLSAIRLSNNMQNATVKSNTFIEDRTTRKMVEGIWEATNNLGNCVYGGNQLQITSGATVPEFVGASSHQGPAWLPVRNKAKTDARSKY